MLNRITMLLCVLMSVLSAQVSVAQTTAPRITTSWSEKVNETNVWKEYPRPLMERNRWKNLNGKWDYAITAKEAARPTSWEGKILVPFCLESALSGVGKSLDADHALWYRLNFSVPGDWTKKKTDEPIEVMLNFGAVDWDATVWVNGEEVGSHKGGYTAFSCNVTKALNFSGDNELVVKVLDGTDTGYQPCGKQRSTARGIWYTPVSGIWQTVWLEPVMPTHINTLWSQCDLANRMLEVHVDCQGGQMLEIKLKSKGKTVTETMQGVTAGTQEVRVIIPADKLHLWSPDDPFLYDMEVTLKNAAGKVYDQVKSYAAMREFGSRRDAEGHMRFTLNGKDIFQFGLLDQGWWPDGLYTAPSPEALYFDIDKTKQWGYNLIRKHVKVEPALWYTHCDRVGIIVWQDMPSGDYSTSPEWQRDGYFRGPSCTRSQASVDNYYREWKEIIHQFKGYFCIASWIRFNEGWGQFDTWSVAKWTKEQDPTRLINPASGGNFFCTGDVLDMHNYPEPKMVLNDPDRVNVVGEYGGIGFPVMGHTWVESDKNWGYVKFSSSKEVTDKYVEFANMLLQLVPQGCSGAIYTQTTDCETEVNGIITYDRKVTKMEEDRFAEINRKVASSLNK